MVLRLCSRFKFFNLVAWMDYFEVSYWLSDMMVYWVLLREQKFYALLALVIISSCGCVDAVRLSSVDLF